MMICIRRTMYTSPVIRTAMPTGRTISCSFKEILQVDGPSYLFEDCVFSEAVSFAARLFIHCISFRGCDFLSVTFLHLVNKISKRHTTLLVTNSNYLLSPSSSGVSFRSSQQPALIMDENQKTKTTLLDLPGEIKNGIYQLACVQQFPVLLCRTAKASPDGQKTYALFNDHLPSPSSAAR